MNAPSPHLLPQTEPPSQSAPGLAITLRDVRKSFAGREILKGVDLHLRPGSFTAIAGRSGSGKTTLLRLIAGLETPDVGTIALDDQPISAHAHAVRVMFQDGRLLPWRRIGANVALGLPAAERHRAETALHAVGLADRAGDWPRHLSGGQKQRAALARALAAQPRLLLLDEPLGALDALTRMDMQRLIEAVWLKSGFTAVLVTHDVTEAALLADRILVIDEGRIALDHAPDLQRPRQSGAELGVTEAVVLDVILRR